jgi:hypothetical protein
VLREFVNGRVLFADNVANEAMAYYGPGGRVDAALQRINQDLQSLDSSTTPTVGLTVAVGRKEITEQYFFVLVNVRA